MPSYATLRRFMSANGLDKRRRLTSRRTDGAERAEARIAEREVRSYEAEYVNGLWHWDFHHGSRKVLTARGEWATPILFGVLDDRSRLACHLQWYLAETAEIVVHGLSQAFQKRGLPRAALSDNGAAMTAAEITEGLARLGILHQTTLPYSPYQNAKQEAFWGPVEGRLIAMLEEVPDLTLELPQRGHPGLGRARVQPQAPLRDRRSADRALPRRPRCARDRVRTAMRCASPSPAPIIAPSARATAPSSSTVAASRCRTATAISTAHRGPLRRLGSRPRPSRRRAHRQRAVRGSIPQDKTQNASGLRRSLDPVSPASPDLDAGAGSAGAPSRRCSPS